MQPTLIRLSPRERALVGQVISGYRIGGLIGTGTTSVVFEATHEQTGRRAAIKVLLGERLGKRKNVDRFFDEARAITEVSHPGLVQLIECGQLPDGGVFILMELLLGQSLEERIAGAQRRGRRLPVPMALRLLRQIAAAMAPVHARGIVHRDLKPENIIVVPDPGADGGEQAKVLDFGIARFLEGDGERRTTVGMVLGSPTYMAPEHCRGRDAGTRSDVYALGVIFYEMLAGQPPFIGDDVAAVMGAHVSAPPPPLAHVRPELPPAAWSLCQALLAKEPEARPELAQVVARLDVILAEESSRRAGAGRHEGDDEASPRPRSHADPQVAARLIGWTDRQLGRWPLLGPSVALSLGAGAMLLLWWLLG